ncbi:MULTISPECIES: cytochrome c oxidase subunit II [Dyella]|uniref:Cytochrome c oxidase subunit 2 n=2 Tax=Dyella TaxID=231454 RepID=A0A4V2NLC4_9GAMM|nr:MULTISPECIES: cytochrome c oxidase subunit II [Dyella]TBR36665.1 cytochrome c oxidase subunit II [Dyella terrae]TCI08244.1 cytochrome c oxidase subunit II [Dyella soli]
MTSGGIRIKAWVAMACALFCGAAWANPEPGQLNMTRGVTEWSSEPYFLNNVALGVCVVIGVLVFGAMFVAMFRFRKSRGAVAEKWSHNTMLEVVWTTIPVIILIVLAYLATGGLKTFADTTGSQMTVKVTGYQWKWRYDYVDYQGKAVEKVGFMSKLDRESDETRQLKSGMDPYAVKVDGYNTYLLNVDEPLVVPTDTKIRFVITAGDVIHSWWVPALGWKMDAIPGIVNAAWTNIKEPGVYRGQCAELCGQDHGFMPIVVKAVPKAEFEQWLAAKEQAAKQPAAPAAPAAASTAAAPATAQVAPATAPQG